MSRRIELIWLGGSEPPAWPLGEAHAAARSVEAVAAATERRLPKSPAEAWLWWDQRLGPPDPTVVERALGSRGDAWHAGLRLGAAGRPGLLDFVSPTWMLNLDPAPEVEATSWRVSPGACLARTEVLRRLGGVRRGFRTLEAAALEMGHRWVNRGALVRYLPWLTPGVPQPPIDLPAEDEVRFLYARRGGFWTRWALGRAVLSGYLGPLQAVRAWRAVAGAGREAEPSPLHQPAAGPPPAASRVTVLLPTVDRYPYLRVVLRQLGEQTVPPHEVLVVDQTPPERRQTGLEAQFPNLPLRVIQLDQAGQCTSRNAALKAATGDTILFLDDDDEIGPDLLEAHLRNLERFGAEVSCGVAEEAGAGALPEAFTCLRASDVFPTNNALVRREALARSGLFDLAYERGSRADGDLGMRLYQSGALMVLNPAIAVLHHHAPQGGLRTHRARAVTYASSRRRLTHRHLPSATEIYLARRYFTPRQVREMLWLRAFGTLSGRGRAVRRLLKAALGMLCLPVSGWQMAQQYRQATRLLREFPRIPALRGEDRYVHN